MIPGFANLNYYEILDISMGVDAKEIQEGYYLLREAFSKNGLASYSLYTPEEREEILRLVEEAYHVLFDEPSRREYDQNLSENRLRAEKSKKILQAALPFDDGTAEPPDPLPATPAENAPAPAAPVQAEPNPAGETSPAPAPNEQPAELAAEPEPSTAAETAPVPETASAEPVDDEDSDQKPETEATTTALALPTALIAGPTEEDGSESEDEPLLLEEEVREEPDFDRLEPAAPVPADPSAPASPAADAAPPEPAKVAAPEPNPPAPVPAPPAAATPVAPPLPTALPAKDKIHRDSEPTPGPRKFSPLDHIREGVTGLSLKRVREQLGATLEQAWEATRIRRPLLQSIEEEEFDKLPAVVFLRGMVAIYAKFLGLPDPEAAAKSYLERMTAAQSGTAKAGADSTRSAR